jgi:hypothetical protein
VHDVMTLGVSYGAALTIAKNSGNYVPDPRRVNHSFRDSSRARRSRAAGRIRDELLTAAPADFFLT